VSVSVTGCVGPLVPVPAISAGGNGFGVAASRSRWPQAREAADSCVQLALRSARLTVVRSGNQARVHVWFEGHFGESYTPLSCTAEALERFVSPMFAVGVRLKRDDRLHIAAPFGLADLFALRLRPNPRRFSANFSQVAAGVTRRWPEVTVEGAILERCTAPT
jgi:hypothetical protein